MEVGRHCINVEVESEVVVNIEAEYFCGSIDFNGGKVGYFCSLI